MRTPNQPWKHYEGLRVMTRYCNLLRQWNIYFIQDGFTSEEQMNSWSSITNNHNQSRSKSDDHTEQPKNKGRWFITFKEADLCEACKYKLAGYGDDTLLL